MPLGSVAARPAARSSLVARVATGTALAAALAALLAAAASLFIADRLILDAEDRRLRGATATVIRETRPTVERAAREPQASRSALEREIADEAEELAPEGIRLAVHDRSGFVAGDAQLGALAVSPETCGSHDVRGSTLRVCAVEAGMLRITAGATRAPHSPTALISSCLLAAGIAALFAALASRQAARWALAPLTRLRESLDRVAADDPKTAAISGDDACHEVAALRFALGALVARLATTLDSARRFSADAAHELKTPLTAIRAELDLLAEESLDAAPRVAVAKLRLRVSALAKLVERLLALATAEDRARLRTEAVAMEDVVREAVARLDPPARARVRLHLEAPGMVLGDELLLAALVDNAVDNALKFSGERPIDVHVDEPDGAVVLDVVDDGPGIPAADRTRAFEPFFRAPSSRSSDAPGHGVGLALVAQIASAHDGAAELVEAEAGRTGAHLRVTLPVWSANRAHASSTNVRTGAPATSSRST